MVPCSGHKGNKFSAKERPSATLIISCNGLLLQSSSDFAPRRRVHNEGMNLGFPLKETTRDVFFRGCRVCRAPASLLVFFFEAPHSHHLAREVLRHGAEPHRHADQPVAHDALHLTAVSGGPLGVLLGTWPKLGSHKRVNQKDHHVCLKGTQLHEPI